MPQLSTHEHHRLHAAQNAAFNEGLKAAHNLLLAQAENCEQMSKQRDQAAMERVPPGNVQRAASARVDAGVLKLTAQLLRSQAEQVLVLKRRGA